MLGHDFDLSIYSPLVLLDHVAVTDISTILNVSPEKLESIDLINSTYIRGNIRYGGILSISSKKRDLAGIDLPEDSYFFNFETLSESPEFSSPDYSFDAGDPRIPDFRNTIYWNENIRIDDSGEFECEFFTSDQKGEYLVLVRGFTPDGLPFKSSTILRVE
jgi:hypothetical protein